jgi:hypothetical protein
MLESVHRVAFARCLLDLDLSPRRADPNDELFDPLKAAVLSLRAGDMEEAFWLVFLFVHFGKNARAGWRYVAEIYGGLGNGQPWNWRRVSQSPAGFRAWLDANLARIRREGVPGGFGNHRKYESLDANSPNGTGAAVETYVNWVAPPRTHVELVTEATLLESGDPYRAFDKLYRSMDAVARFGRTARFDYLTMLGKLGLAAIQPGSTYMEGATGPARGARLLFGVDASQRTLDQWVVQLGSILSLGMQEMEDSLCNWQKSPAVFRRFRG